MRQKNLVRGFVRERGGTANGKSRLRAHACEGGGFTLTDLIAASRNEKQRFICCLVLKDDRLGYLIDLNAEFSCGLYRRLGSSSRLTRTWTQRIFRHGICTENHPSAKGL